MTDETKEELYYFTYRLINGTVLIAKSKYDEESDVFILHDPYELVPDDYGFITPEFMDDWLPSSAQKDCYLDSDKVLTVTAASAVFISWYDDKLQRIAQLTKEFMEENEKEEREQKAKELAAVKVVSLTDFRKD